MIIEFKFDDCDDFEELFQVCEVISNIISRFWNKFSDEHKQEFQKITKCFDVHNVSHWEDINDLNIPLRDKFWTYIKFGCEKLNY